MLVCGWKDMPAAPSWSPGPFSGLKEIRHRIVRVVGAARDITIDELRIECMFPADDATEANHVALVGKH